MALDQSEVRAGLDGGIYVAPVGTTAPTTPTAALDAAWAHLGYMNDDGVSLDPSQDREEFAAWQSIYPVRRVLTGASFDLAFVCIQTNKDVLELYFPDSVITSDAGVHSLTIPANPGPAEKALLFEWIDGEIHNRIIVARGEVTDVEELEVQRGNPASYGMTFSAYPGDENEIAVWLSDDPALESAMS